MEEKITTVLNIEYTDSEEEVVEEVENLDITNDYDSTDEATEEYQDILNTYLGDIASVDCLGLKAYKIDFYDTNIEKLEDKKCKCDFDLDDNGYPTIPDGGEEFIIPYLFALSKKVKFFKKCVFETNINHVIKL